MDNEAHRVIPFYFESNSWFGRVDSREKWLNLLTQHSYHEVINAKMAPKRELDQLPPNYYFGAQGVRTGTLPSFGFRREHIPGKIRLEDWAKEQGMDLFALSQKIGRKKRRWWLLWLA